MRMTRKEDLTAQGFERKATCDESRLSEAADTYKGIDREVHLEPFHADEEPGIHF